VSDVDPDAAAREFSRRLALRKGSTGIPPHPSIEVSDTTIDVTPINFELDAPTSAQAFPGGQGPPPPPPLIACLRRVTLTLSGVAIFSGCVDDPSANSYSVTDVDFGLEPRPLRPAFISSIFPSWPSDSCFWFFIGLANAIGVVNSYVDDTCSTPWMCENYGQMPFHYAYLLARISGVWYLAAWSKVEVPGFTTTRLMYFYAQGFDPTTLIPNVCTPGAFPLDNPFINYFTGGPAQPQFVGAASGGTATLAFSRI
jgi:hypothetical protein